MKSYSRRFFSWLWLFLGIVYFFLPLLASFLFSLRGKKGVLSFVAYRHVFADPQFLKTFGFSLEMAVFTVIVGLALIVPTAIWIHLRVPRAKTPHRCFCPPPLRHSARHPGLRAHPQLFEPPLATRLHPCASRRGYVIIAFPYIYRSVDAGLRAMDLRGLTEAAQSLGSGWVGTIFRVILPNLRSSLLSAIFLTFAIVIGELTLAVLLAWPAFGPYMALVGRNLAYEPAALAILSFALTWGSIGIIQAVSRGAPGQRSNLGRHPLAREILSEL